MGNGLTRAERAASPARRGRPAALPFAQGSGSGRQLEGGVTLIELMIYLVVVSILGAPILMITLSVSRASAEGDMLSKILERNRSCMQRFATEYRESLHGSLVVSNAGRTIQFTPTIGFDGAAPILGAPITYEIRTVAGESANGADDNGNGLADEGVVVRAQNGEEVAIASAVSVATSSFAAAANNGVTINLVTFGITKGTSLVSEARRTLTVFPRN